MEGGFAWYYSPLNRIQVILSPIKQAEMKALSTI